MNRDGGLKSSRPKRWRLRAQLKIEAPLEMVASKAADLLDVPIIWAGGKQSMMKRLNACLEKVGIADPAKIQSA